MYLDEPTIKYRQHINNQIGAKRYTDRFTNFEDVRDHLINVKINIFSSYVENKELFSDEYRNFNKIALEYFENLKKVKYINFKKISIFHKLYKFERFSNYLVQYIILNFPFLGKIGYNIKRKKGI